MKEVVTKCMKYLVFGVPIAATILDSVVCVAKVKGVSMQPCLNPDPSSSDYILQDIFTVKPYYNFCRGEIVCFVHPKNPDECLIKQITGLPGDEIIRGNSEILKIPSGHVWVEGENLPRSIDSNAFGPVPLGLIYARATHIVWPLHRIKSLKMLVDSQ